MVNLFGQLREEHVSETLSAGMMQEYRLIPRLRALRQIHFPETAGQLEEAELRLKFDELFYIQLRLFA
jgi:ATP-dependent DNA helicase RecG